MALERFRRALFVLTAFLVPFHALGVLPLDPSFGNGGAVGAPIPGFSSATALAIQPDRKIVAAVTLYPRQGVLLVRFEPNGSLDSTFGDAGIAIRFGTDSLAANALALQPDGRILVAGVGFPALPNQSFFLARFLTNGDPDPSFGSGGLVLTDFPGLVSGASALRLDADGKPIVAGFAGASLPAPTSDLAVARYDAGGNLDSGFGAGGRVLVDMGGPGGFPEGANAIVVEAGGRIILGATTGSPSGGFALAGLLPDGSLDPSFGSAGRFYSDAGVECRGLALQPDGRIVAVGASFTGMVVLRLSANGVLDPGFGAGGITNLTNRYSAFAVAIDPAGRIVVGGQPDFVVARLLPNGQPDTTVGPEGWQSANLDFGGNFHARANALGVQDDGRILLGGDQSYIGVSFLLLQRYLGSVVPVPALGIPAAVLLVLLLGVVGTRLLRG